MGLFCQLIESDVSSYRDDALCIIADLVKRNTGPIIRPYTRLDSVL